MNIPDITGIHNDPVFGHIRKILSTRFGHEAGITINALAITVGLVKGLDEDGRPIPDRRACEQLLEIGISQCAFGFAVCAGPTGCFRPDTLSEINGYLASLESRMSCLWLRIKGFRRAVESEGGTRDGRRFSTLPPREELFDTSIYVQERDHA